MTRKFLLVLLASGASLIASTNLLAAPATPSSASSTSPEQAAREEIVRRQEAQITARKLIDEGEKVYYSGKYLDAVVKVEEAIRILPRALATEVDYSRAVQSLATSYSRLADAAFQAGDYTKARELAHKAPSPAVLLRVNRWIRPPNSSPAKTRSRSFSVKARF
jgi:hypothetical protein